MNIVSRMLNNITPLFTRATGGTFITFLPNGAGLLGAAGKQCQAHATAAWKYGAVQALLAATANVDEAWVEEVVVGAATAAAKEYFVALTSNTALGAAANIEAEVPVSLVATSTVVRVPLRPPVHFNRLTAINVGIACGTAAKKASVYAVISRRK